MLWTFNRAMGNPPWGYSKTSFYGNGCLCRQWWNDELEFDLWFFDLLLEITLQNWFFKERLGQPRKQSNQIQRRWIHFQKFSWNWCLSNGRKLGKSKKQSHFEQKTNSVSFFQRPSRIRVVLSQKRHHISFMTDLTLKERWKNSRNYGWHGSQNGHPDRRLRLSQRSPYRNQGVLVFWNLPKFRSILTKDSWQETSKGQALDGGQCSNRWKAKDNHFWIFFTYIQQHQYWYWAKHSLRFWVK